MARLIKLPAPAIRQPRHQLTVPRVRCSTFGCRSFASAGPTVWNSLPNSLHNPAVGPHHFRGIWNPPVSLFAFRWQRVIRFFTYLRYTNVHLLTYFTYLVYYSCSTGHFDCGHDISPPGQWTHSYELLHLLHLACFSSTITTTFDLATGFFMHTLYTRIQAHTGLMAVLPGEHRLAG